MNFPLYYCTPLTLEMIIPVFCMFLALILLHFFNSAYCKGEAKATNKLRELMLSLRKSTVPPLWRSQYATRMSLSLGEWVTDLISRTRALSTKYTAGLKNCVELMKCAFWVGGMFTPEAFVTATRQQTAQVKSFPLVT